MIFSSRDVGQDGVLVAFLDEAHGNAGDRTLERNARLHESQTCTANTGHRGRTIRFEDVGNDAQGVGRLVLARQHCGNSALSQSAVTNLAPSGAGHAAHFAHRERREVVMQHEALALLALIGFEAL